MEYKYLLRNTLSQEAFWSVNKKIALLFGIESALILSDLISKEKYFEDRNQLQPDGSFFNDQESIEKDTTLSPHKQRKALKLLSEYNLIEIEKKGIPAKNYYKLNHSIITEILVTKEINLQSLKNLTTGSESFKFINNKNKDNKNKEINKRFSEENTSSQELKINPLIEFWNSITLMTKYKSLKTKTYEETLKMIKRLKNGTFNKYHKIDKDFIQRNKIDLKLLNKKWTDEEIKEGMLNLVKMQIEGYWPEDKTKFPKDFKTLLYNYRSGTSFFMMAVATPPKPLNNSVRSIPENIEVYSLFENYFSEFTSNSRKKEKLIINVNSFTEEAQNILKEVSEYYSHTSFSRFLGTPNKPVLFAKLFLDFIKGRNKKALGYIHPDSLTFSSFISEVQKVHGYILKPSTHEKKKLEREKRNYELRYKNRKRMER